MILAPVLSPSPPWKIMACLSHGVPDSGSFFGGQGVEYFVEIGPGLDSWWLCRR